MIKSINQPWGISEKYAQRYGKIDGKNRKDLFKVLHYAIMAVHNHDLTLGGKDENK